MKRHKKFNLPDEFEEFIDTKKDDIGLRIQIFWATKNVRECIAGLGDGIPISRLASAIRDLHSTLKAQHDELYEEDIKNAEEAFKSQTIEQLVPDPDRRYRMSEIAKAKLVSRAYDESMFNVLVTKFEAIQMLIDRKNLGLEKVASVNLEDEW